MAGTPRTAVKVFGHKSEVKALREELNKVITDLETLRVAAKRASADQVLPNQVAAGLSVDVNAQDFETDAAVWVRHNGKIFSVAAVAAFDWSVSGTCAGDTVATSKSGAFWVFANTAGVLDVEDAAGNQAFDTELEAVAQYAKATNALPPGADDLPIGLIIVTEGGSGAWTAGTDSISGETETFVDFLGTPGVEAAAASLAIGATASAFTYGAGSVRLGSGARVAYTGKANVAIGGSNIADGKVGAYLIYVLADDSEFALQLGAAYGTLAAAQAAVADHNRNPYLPVIGVLYVENKTGAAFIPATTLLNASGVTATFVIEQPDGSSTNAQADLTAATVNA